MEGSSASACFVIRRYDHRIDKDPYVRGAELSDDTDNRMRVDQLLCDGRRDYRHWTMLEEKSLRGHYARRLFRRKRADDASFERDRHAYPP